MSLITTTVRPCAPAAAVNSDGRRHDGRRQFTEIDDVVEDLQEHLALQGDNNDTLTERQLDMLAAEDCRGRFV